MTETRQSTVRSADGTSRCWWCDGSEIYQRYHDDEWGFPILDGMDEDRRLFEKICLEGFQAGLSWLTILRKRENFRESFHGFELSRVASMTRRKVDRLMRNSGIVRHRGKIESAINNAQRAIDVIEHHGSLATYLWSFAPDKHPVHRTGSTVPAQTPASAELSRQLRKQGWSFVGPTTMYAFMQSVGMVNDHLRGCSAYEPAATARLAYLRTRAGLNR